MATALLTKRIEFSASHRYYNDTWSAARNLEVFGACSNVPGHGHNYLLEVTVAGEIDEETGMVVNLYDLKQVLKRVLVEFDHKHLNLDTPYFATESFSKEGELAQASLTRRYHFSAAHRVDEPRWTDARQTEFPRICDGSDLHGHNYTLQVTVSGPIDSETGMVTNLVSLDRVVQQRIIGRFGYRNLNFDPDLAQGLPTGMNIARFIWMLLGESIPGGRLVKIGLTETADVSYEYEGSRAI
jgi:6-pyruvoyltetrahydropterin/6-carboxytetrahydropterin synthase